MRLKQHYCVKDIICLNVAVSVSCCCSKSFMLSSLGFTCVAFVSGALALWAPEYMIKSLHVESATVNEATYVTLSVINNDNNNN